MSDFIKTDVQPPLADESIRDWLTKQLNEQRPTLLAFADDGVIWGRLTTDGQLVTSHELDGAISPELRNKTLQQAFVFGAADEVRLFHAEMGGWKVARVADGDTVIKESQILWGDKSEGQPQNGFLHVSEYRSGIPDQYLPLDKPLGDGECVRLEVHHLVKYDPETGEARIALSRLAGLSIGQRDLEVVK